MSWEDRDYSSGEDGRGGMGRPGGDWRGFRPTFDNPMTWSLSLGRYFGIEVRVHLFMLLFILIMLAKSLVGAVDKDQGLALDSFFTILSLAGLFIIVLLHEFGHCFACRMVGGQADEILMWPLGGLAMCRAPQNWKANFWTVVGGPMVNVIIGVILAITLGIMTGYWWNVGIPLVPFVPQEIWYANHRTTLTFTLYLIASINVVLLLFNLLPVFPLDGGRLVQSLLWPKTGYVRSMRLAVYSGYCGAIAMVVAAFLVPGMWTAMLLAIAIFGGLTCYTTLKQLQFTEEVMGFQYDEYALKLEREIDEEQVGTTARKPASKRVEKREAREAEARTQEAAELDRLLQKIADTGMDSLSGREKRWLEKHSKKKKQGG